MYPVASNQPSLDLTRLCQPDLSFFAGWAGWAGVSHPQHTGSSLQLIPSRRFAFSPSSRSGFRLPPRQPLLEGPMPALHGKVDRKPRKRTMLESPAIKVYRDTGCQTETATVSNWLCDFFLYYPLSQPAAAFIQLKMAIIN
ncbi:unnamed protein product [Protopolystoma xenopodis]|uniref:Uncharacterized protein n=1 Tax=Protopolystoma xenopodis TaxID=117903 RepID=A0A3S5A681_9PLAT|nr:unnamed protein product [Protopolystoma xenopodis]